jgi:hypothetical protein
MAFKKLTREPKVADYSRTASRLGKIAPAKQKNALQQEPSHPAAHGCAAGLRSTLDVVQVKKTRWRRFDKTQAIW